jgi:hypothetical protein
MSEPVYTTRGSLKIFRFTFPKVSDGMRDFTIASFDITTATIEDAKKDAIVYLETNIGAAVNAVTPEQAVERATIELVAANVMIVEVK